MIEAEVVKKKLVQKTTLDYFNKDLIIFLGIGTRTGVVLR